METSEAAARSAVLARQRPVPKGRLGSHSPIAAVTGAAFEPRVGVALTRFASTPGRAGPRMPAWIGAPASRAANCAAGPAASDAGIAMPAPVLKGKSGRHSRPWSSHPLPSVPEATPETPPARRQKPAGRKRYLFALWTTMARAALSPGSHAGGDHESLATGSPSPTGDQTMRCWLCVRVTGLPAPFPGDVPMADPPSHGAAGGPR